MKSIKERYNELFDDEGSETYICSKTTFEVLNKEYFEGKLNIIIENKEFESTEFFTEYNIDGRGFRCNECLDYLQNLYDLQSLKRKLDNI